MDGTATPSPDSRDPFAELDDDELAAKVPVAQANAESLAATATEAEQAAAAADADFKTNPSAKSHTAAAVARQIAANARQATDRAAAEASALAVAHERRVKLRRVAELEPDADFDTLIERVRATAREHIPTALAALAELGRAITVGVETRNRAVIELATLSAALGVPAPLGMRDQVSIDSIAQRLSPLFEQEFGKAKSAHLRDGTYVGQDPPQFLLQACGRALTADEFALYARVAARWSAESPSHTTENAK